MTEASRIVTGALASLYIHLADLHGRLLLAETEAQRWILQKEISEVLQMTNKLQEVRK